MPQRSDRRRRSDRPRSSGRPRQVLSAVDPVSAFLVAHDAGEQVQLATSGTSGAPRSVVRTTGSWVASFPVVAELAGLGGRSRVWVPGPLSATMNLFAAVHATVLGLPLVGDLADATHAHLTPTALARLLDGGAPLSGRTVVVAGDGLSAPLHDRAVAAGATVQHYYGASELSFVAWGRHAGDLRPFPGVDVEVRDGEIWVRTPYLCSRYAGPPGPLRVGPDGFATVGDRGVLTGPGLTVLGRPGAVLVGGATVEPGDVESVLRGAAWGEVVVVGVPHPSVGHVLAVALTERSDHGSLRSLARDRLEGPRRPRLWFHVPTLPRTPAGKVDRETLVSALSADTDRPPRLV